MKYAGIGSRETPANVLQVMSDIAVLMAIDGHICCTGAALGADQAFANGANRVHGAIELSIPWNTYEFAWSCTLHNVKSTAYDANVHKAAADSVHKFHPYAAKLKQGAFKLHARNYLIIDGCALVICWTTDGKASGGTGQGIRIAESLGIPVYNLGNAEVLQAFVDRINARRHEITAYTKHSAPE